MDSAASEPIKSLCSLVEPGNSQQRGWSLARRRAAAQTSVSYSCRIYDNARAEALQVAALWFQQVLDAFDLVLQPGIQSKRGGSSEGWHRLETADGREWSCWQEVTDVNKSFHELNMLQSVFIFYITNYICKYVICFYKCRSWIITERSAASCSTMIGLAFLWSTLR